MARKTEKLTRQFLRGRKKPGDYSDGDGLYLIVGEHRKPNYDGDNQSQRWAYRYRATKFGKPGKRREMSLGLLRDVTAAEARRKAHEARTLIAEGIDPIEHRKEQERQRKKADRKQITFKTVADKFVLAQTTKIRPWSDATRNTAIAQINGYLKPLHDIPIKDITPQDIYDIIEPLRLRVPAQAHNVLIRAHTIIDWGYVVDAMPADRMNPASMKGPLRKMFGADNIAPDHEPHDAIPFEKIPALWTLLDSIKPRTHYTVGEVARAHGKTRVTVYNAIAKGRLRTNKPENPVFAGSWQEHSILPDDAVALWGPRIVDVIPGLPPVTLYFLKFLILNGARRGEVTYMPWSEWHRKENLWVIPWQRMKGRNRSGRKPIKIDHVIPLGKISTEILQMLEAQQKRDKIDDNTKFVFANYMTANQTSARIGEPLSSGTLANLLGRMLLRLNDDQPLGRGDLSGTLHGMRTCFRSWLDVQRIDGRPRFAEVDMERAIAHVRGYGETDVSRLYSRQSKEVAPLIEIFDAWENYVTGGQSAEIIPLHIPFTDKPIIRPHPYKAYPEAIAKNQARFAARKSQADKTKTERRR
jgi:integrase